MQERQVAIPFWDAAILGFAFGFGLILAEMLAASIAGIVFLVFLAIGSH